MNSPQDCFLCHKHRRLNEYTGEVLAESGGWLLTHFPHLEDERATRGHLLIEPSRHITDLSEMNEIEAPALGDLIRKGSLAIKTLLRAEHVYLFRINDKVAHLHFHLIPRYPETPKDFWGLKIMTWPDRPIVDLEGIRDLSRELKRIITS